MVECLKACFKKQLFSFSWFSKLQAKSLKLDCRIDCFDKLAEIGANPYVKSIILKCSNALWDADDLIQPLPTVFPELEHIRVDHSMNYNGTVWISEMWEDLDSVRYFLTHLEEHAFPVFRSLPERVALDISAKLYVTEMSDNNAAFNHYRQEIENLPNDPNWFLGFQAEDANNFPNWVFFGMKREWLIGPRKNCVVRIVFVRNEE